MAIDNPDAPDYLGEFETRTAPIELSIINNSQTTLDYVEGYKKLESSLDKELNSAYQQLMAKLELEQKEMLKKSQRQWITFRDKEFSFIGNNWSRQNFGSSSAISVGAYRTQLIRNRTRQLLTYLKNYS
jgi:uncharacterized protein YecT (DUF1311 family)